MDTSDQKKRKRRAYPLSLKRDIIKAGETKKVSELIKEFGLKDSTIRKILKQKEKILDAIIDDAINLKRTRLDIEIETNDEIQKLKGEEENTLLRRLSAFQNRELSPDDAEKPTTSTRISRKLTLQEKKEIIEASETEKAADVVKKFDLKKSTYYDIIRLKGKIMKAIDEGESTKRIRIKPPTYLDLEIRLIEWVTRAKTEGQKINGPIIREKAKKMAEESGLTTFRASNGWLEKFKKRYGLRLPRGQELEFENKNNNEFDAKWVENFLENLLKEFVPKVEADSGT